MRIFRTGLNTGMTGEDWIGFPVHVLLHIRKFSLQGFGFD